MHVIFHYLAHRIDCDVFDVIIFDIEPFVKITSGEKFSIYTKNRRKRTMTIKEGGKYHEFTISIGSPDSTIILGHVGYTGDTFNNLVSHVDFKSESRIQKCGCEFGYWVSDMGIPHLDL